jgi:soluble lytic murein transglycosylase
MSQYGWDANFNDLKAIPFPDTREYVTRVLRDRDKYYLLYRDRLAIR